MDDLFFADIVLFMGKFFRSGKFSLVWLKPNSCEIKILKSSFENREYIQKKEHGRFGYSKTQYLKISGDKSQRKHAVIS